MNGSLKDALTRWLVMTVALWAATAVVPGVACDRWPSLVVAGLVLSLLNVFVKPALSLISIPFIIATFGVFLLVINAALLGFTSWLVDGFAVKGFWPAVGGSLIVSLVSFFLGRPAARTRFTVRRDAGAGGPTAGRGPPPGRGPIIDV